MLQCPRLRKSAPNFKVGVGKYFISFTHGSNNKEMEKLESIFFCVDIKAFPYFVFVLYLMDVLFMEVRRFQEQYV